MNEDLGIDLPVDADISLERFAQLPFERQYTIYSRGMIPKRIVDETDPRFQLPDNSTVHFTSHFLTPSEDSHLQVHHLPLMQHEAYQTYYGFVLDLPGEHSYPFPVHDRIVYTRSRVTSQVQKAYQADPSVRRLMSVETTSRRRNALMVLDYSALHQMRVQGSMKGWRRTAILLRTMLENIVKANDGRNHFLYFPISGDAISRAKVLRTFSKVTQSSVGGNEDPSFMVLCQLLGFVYGHHTSVEVEADPNDTAMVAAYHTAEAAGGAIPPLCDPEDFPTNSLFWRIPKVQLSKINLILTHEGRMIIYNLEDLAKFSENSSTYQAVLRHIHILKMSGDEDFSADDLEQASEDELEARSAKRENAFATLLPDSAPEDDSIADNEARTYSGDDLATLNPPILGAKQIAADTALPAEEPDTDLEPDIVDTPAGPQAPQTPTLPSQKVQAQLAESLPFAAAFHGKLDEYLHTLDDTARKRTIKLLDRQRNIKIGSKSLEEHLAAPVPTLTPEVFTENASLHPDTSTQQSVMTKLDRVYIEEVLDQDIAKTFLFFNKFGFFVNGVTESIEHDRMNSTRVFKVDLVHSDGSRHRVPLSFPQPDSEGNVLSNGNTFRMTKQMIANPICKISPTRVNLSSNFNKSIVERISTVRGSYGTYLLKIVAELVKKKLVEVTYGRSRPGPEIIPYEYAVLSGRYNSLSIPNKNGYRFILDYDNRFDGLLPTQLEFLMKKEELYGCFCGYAPNGNLLFWDMEDKIHAVTTKGEHITSTPHFLQIVGGFYPAEIEKSVPYEYTTVKVIDRVYPLAFVVGFTKGLDWILDHYKVQYRWVDKGQRLSMTNSDLRIRFQDGSLIFSRYPLEASLILAGLSWCNTQFFTRESFNKPDVYYHILEMKGISTNQLKGITSFVDTFVDPISEEVLRDLGEPTETIGLFLRASAMLTYLSHYQASSVRHHRLRGYERIPSILFNELARRLARYNTERGRNKQFTINPEAVYLRVMNDPTMEIVETINPIQELRTLTRASYAGLGGRSGRSFVVEDRRFPEDGVGVISEATPDSGKVGLSFSTPFNPRIKSLRGALTPFEAGSELAGGQKFSIPPLLFAGAAQDDERAKSHSF